MIHFEIANKVTFPVEGSTVAEDGSITPFTFKLVAQRLNADALKAKQDTQGDQSQEDFLVEVCEDWKDVRRAIPGGVGTEPMPYDGDALRTLLNSRPGLTRIAFRSYMAAISAKEKN